MVDVTTWGFRVLVGRTLIFTLGLHFEHFGDPQVAIAASTPFPRFCTLKPKLGFFTFSPLFYVFLSCLSFFHIGLCFSVLLSSI